MTSNEELNVAKVSAEDLLQRKFEDVMVPGFEVVFSPPEADLAGAFSEGALTVGDALASSSDMLQLTSAEDDGDVTFMAGVSDDLPTQVSTTNSDELFAINAGESVLQAIARSDLGGK